MISAMLCKPSRIPTSRIATRSFTPWAPIRCLLRHIQTEARRLPAPPATIAPAREPGLRCRNEASVPSRRGESTHVDPDPRRHRLYRPSSRPASGSARRGNRLHGHQPADREFLRPRQAGPRHPRRCQPVRRRDERDARGQTVARHQPRLLARQRAPAARRVQAQHPRHGQLLRGGAGLRRQPGRLCQLIGGVRRAEILRRPARHRGRFPPRPCAIRDAQDLQRMAGAGLPRKARHGDHRDPSRRT